MSKKEVIYSTEGRPYKCPHGTNCNSKGLIYLIECKRCPRRNQYIGQTSRSLKERMNGHRAAYNSGKKMPLYQHLRRKDHNFASITVTIIDVLPEANSEQLLTKEEEWITRLNTRLPNGLNSLYS